MTPTSRILLLVIPALALISTTLYLFLPRTAFSQPIDTSSESYFSRLSALRLSASKAYYETFLSLPPSTANLLSIYDESSRNNLHTPSSPRPKLPDEENFIYRPPFTFPRPGSTAWSSPKDELMRLFDLKTVIVFSKSTCPYSKRAKDVLLRKYNIVPEPFVVELDKVERGGELYEELKKMSGRRTVPNVVIAGSSLGGADEIENLDRQNQLAEAIWNKGDGYRIQSIYQITEDGQPAGPIVEMP